MEKNNQNSLPTDLPAIIAEARRHQEAVEAIRKRNGGWFDVVLKRWVPYEDDTCVQIQKVIECERPRGVRL